MLDHMNSRSRPPWILVFLAPWLLLTFGCPDAPDDDAIPSATPAAMDDTDGDGFDPADDCDDGNPDTYPGAIDIPYDGIDQDCDGEDLTDVDQDGFDAEDAGGDDCDDNDPTVHPGAEEIPDDGIDNDCDGLVDEGFIIDDDEDGYDDEDDCDDDDPATYPGAEEIPYDGIDQDCDGSDLTDVDQDGYDWEGVPGGDDCNDNDPTIHPDAEEIPYDHVDQDCDGEDLTDVDGDGYDGEEAGGDDCNDNDPTIHPGAEEIPDDGIDNDCDGLIDEQDGDDDDNDGHGDDDCNDQDAGIYPGAEEIPYDGIDQDCDGSDLTDVDQDGHDAEEVGGDDCDDNDPEVNPDMEEIPYDGIDQDCDGSDLTDVDQDGFDAEEAGGDDCDDNDPNINPDATEIPYDGIDQDCSGDDLDDVDGDGYPGGEDGTDCDDNDPNTHPGANEVCDNKDNDCDGEVDEGAIDVQTFYVDSDGDQYGDPFNQVDQCFPTGDLVDNDQDCNDDDPYINPAATEICDKLDNDCDGAVDEGVTTTFYIDADQDGYGSPNTSSQACSAPSGYVADDTDCNDKDKGINPGATEVCDPEDVDENCNGVADDDDPTTDESTKTYYYPDSDRDAYGDSHDPGLLVCNDPSTQYVTFRTNNDDCDDANNTIHPNAEETCNNEDDDCDGEIDEGVGTNTFFLDSDGDGYGDASTFITACFDPPDGYVSNKFDCDDTNPDIHPGAQETCNELDDDCDGKVDEGVGETYYRDADGDGFGTSDDTIQACSMPTGYVSDQTDCDDTRADVNPDAPEVCDDADTDEDCDGKPDDADPEGARADTLDPFYPDADRDSFGDENAAPEYRCDPPVTTPGEYWSENNDDCDDLDPSINPDGVEVLNLKDDNCNGLIDEGLYKPDCAWILAADPAAPTGRYFIDPDGDFYGVDPFEVYCEMEMAGGGWTLVAKLTNQDDKHWINSAESWTGDDYYGDTVTMAAGSDAKSQAWSTVAATEMMFTDNFNYADQLYVATNSNCLNSMTMSEFFGVALSGFPNTAVRDFYARCEVDHNYVPNWATEPNWGNNNALSPNISLNANSGPHILIAAVDYNDSSAVISFYREGYTEFDVGLATYDGDENGVGFGTQSACQDIGGPTNCFENDTTCQTYYPETVLLFVR